MNIKKSITAGTCRKTYIQAGEKYTHGETKNLLAKQNLPQPLHFSDGLSLIILLNRLKQETKLNHL